jgi:protein NrfC
VGSTGKKNKANTTISRRTFLKTTGIIVVGISTGCASPGMVGEEKPALLLPASQGYLLVDVKKCQGCASCMLACSLAHEGKANLSNATIQILQNPFQRYPYDMQMAVCRQCLNPRCLDTCPTGALHIDGARGNVRIIDRDRCVGCGSCHDACPYEPSRSIWRRDGEPARKCDLCINTPFWSETGGAEGKQACVEICPLHAIAFTKEIPVQAGSAGYRVNLRGRVWEEMGYDTEDDP